MLVDAGPPGEGIGDALRGLGVERVAAVFVTHDQLDHAGGAPRGPRERPRRPARGRRPGSGDDGGGAHRAASPSLRVAEGSELRFGRAHPARALAAARGPRRDRLRRGRQRALARPDAGWRTLERAADRRRRGRGDAALVPGPFDVLKVAHHGSDDAGLEALLETSAPRIALIEVGADNAYGHPNETTIATLAERGVCALRTDIDGDVGVEIGPEGLEAFAEHGLDQSRPGCEPGF